MNSNKRDFFAQSMGFCAFALGLGIIVEVLWIALQMFNDRNLGFHPVTPAGPTVAEIGVGFGVLVLKIALLFLGSLSGSLIANKGVKLYFSGSGVIGRALEAQGMQPEKTVDIRELIELENPLPSHKAKV